MTVSFDMLDHIRNMTGRAHYFLYNMWRKKVWDKAWYLEDIHCRITSRLHKSLDLFTRMCKAGHSFKLVGIVGSPPWSDNQV